MPYKPNEREYRTAEPFTLPNENNADELVLRGTPIVFDTPTVLFEEDGIEYKEVIARGALDGCDMSDFIFNRNHGQNDITGRTTLPCMPVPVIIPSPTTSRSEGSILRLSSTKRTSGTAIYTEIFKNAALTK